MINLNNRVLLNSICCLGIIVMGSLAAQTGNSDVSVIKGVKNLRIGGIHYKTLNQLMNDSKGRASAVQFSFDIDETGLVQHLSGKLSEDARDDFKSIAAQFLNTNKSLFGFDDLESNFLQKQVSTDHFGMMHLTLQQIHQGIPVLHHLLKVHTDVDGSISAVSNKYSRDINISTTPQISQSDAIALAREHIGNINAAYKDVELVIYPDNNVAHLTYKFDVLSSVDNAWTYLVDAHNGEILNTFSLIFPEATFGIGINALGETIDSLNIYSGSDFNWEDIQVISDLIDTVFGFPSHIPATGNYNLVDESDILLGRIITTTSEEPYLFNLSFVNSITDSFNVDSMSHFAGVSAHDYHRKTLDYYHQKFGREGWLYPGSRILGSVDYGHGDNISVNNAYYNHWAKWVKYGMGEGPYGPWSAGIDVCAHEMAHGVTAHSSGLIYQNQSGGLNESFSDVMGYLVEAEYQDGGDWLMAEDVSIYGSPIRNMQDPPAESQPDHINHSYYVPFTDDPNSENDYGGVHTNSGIPNKVFYLVVQGDAHYGYNISPFDLEINVSRDIAANIWYTWNERYLNPWDNFQSSYEKMLQVCSSLYPGNNAYYSSIQIAWASVGISQHCEVSLSPSYVAPGTGELGVRALIPSTGNTYTVLAEIFSFDSSTVDSIPLYDDGLHNDDNPADQIWGGFWLADSVENSYSVNVIANDSNTGLIDLFINVAQFTTIGPIRVDTVTTPYNDNPPIPGSDIYYQIHLKNNGLFAEAKDVSMLITAESDSFVTLLSTTELEFGDIPADSSVVSIGFYSIRLNSDIPVDEDITFYMKIFSEDYYFWNDSFTVHVYPLGTGGEEDVMPDKFALHQNYPNPFNPVTTIQYELPQRSNIQITIYDLMGRKVTTLISESQDAGCKSIQWDATNISSGMYFYQIKAGEFVQTCKMILLN